MIEKNPLISIVMLNYNGLEYIQKTIPAVLGLNYTNYELIVVDNASTDGSVEFIEKFEGVKLLKNSTNLGYSAGKNVGVNAARGRYILLLDEDILIDSTLSFDYLVGAMSSQNILSISFLLKDAHTDLTEYYGGFYSYIGIKERKRVDYRKVMALKDDLVRIGSPDGGALLIDRDAFISSGSYDTSQPYFLDVGDFGIRGTILTGKNNYLFTRSCFTHLGQKRKTDNKIWRWKFYFVLPGLTKIILKNYKTSNILKIYPLTFAFVFLKALKQALFRKDLKILGTYLSSVSFTVKSLGQVFHDRKIIQAKRILSEDTFLKIKPPLFG